VHNRAESFSDRLAVDFWLAVAICHLACVQDVHEIKFGADWQDALNIAVSNCQVFVPLVTPRYGETLWTNREVCHSVVNTSSPVVPSLINFICRLSLLLT